MRCCLRSRGDMSAMVPADCQAVESSSLRLFSARNAEATPSFG